VEVGSGRLLRRRPNTTLNASIRVIEIDGDLNVGSWHNPDLQRPLELGPIMAALPTFGAECLVIAAFQTWRRGVVKVGT